MTSAFIKVSVALWLLFPQASLYAASFQPLTDAATGDYLSFASDVSPDGQFVSGFGPAPGPRAMRWSSPGIIDVIGDLPGGSDEGYGSGIANDGSSLSGHGSGICEEGWRWTESAGFSGVGDLPGGACFSHANGISGDGSVVIGRSDSTNGIEAYRWTALGGVEGLGDLAGEAFFSYAEAISEDGSAIVGGSISGAGFEAFRWTDLEGMVGLGDLPGGSFDSFANGVSSDGSLIVGQSDSHGLPPFPPVVPPGFSSPPNNPGWEAFLWTQASNQMQGLGDLSGGDFFSIAFDVSDNALVVGFGTTDAGGEAFIWDSVNGIRNLKSVLETQGLAGALAGWTLQVATAISKDGRYVVGFGINPAGLTQAWIAQLDPFNQDPACESAQASPNLLWPPNHKFALVEVIGASDPDGDTMTITVTGVTQDEPVNGLGDGNTSPDAVLQDEGVLLRSERQGNGDGRVYQISFTADDGSGGHCTGTVIVCVPHDRRNNTCVDSGQVYNSTQS
jgi:probable HAF family extracellular repeat protein